MRRLSAKERVKLKLLLRLLPGYALFFGCLVAIGLIYGNIIGMVCLFVAFVALRYQYDNAVTYHDDSTKKCIALSILLFAISGIILIVFDIRVSLIACVPVAVGITWLLYQFGLKKELEIKLLKLTQPKPFDLDNCTEAELVERCRQCFKRDVEYKTERAIKHFILKLPHEEIDMNPEQSKKERYRFRKLLQ